MKYFVVSYGGAGTHLIKGLINNNNYLKIGKDKSYWQQYPHHLKNPPKSFGEKVRLIYIFSNPYNSITYHYRFGKNTKWPRIHRENMGGEFDKVNIEWNLDDYLNNGKDLFKFEEHFDNWTNIKDKDYEIMVIKYEDIEKNKKRIKEFININKDFNIRERRTDWTKLNSSTKEKLVDMYGNFYKKYVSYPSIKIY